MNLQNTFHLDFIVLLINFVIISLANTNRSPSLKDVNFGKTFVGVVFSPYTKNWEQSTDGTFVVPSKVSYTLSEIKIMLRVVSKKFNSIIVQGMGVTGDALFVDLVESHSNPLKSWEEWDAECLVAKAAAEINAEDKNLTIQVAQGIRVDRQTVLDRTETNNAFAAVEYANKIYPRTVWSIIHLVSPLRLEMSVEQMSKFHQEMNQRANKLGLKFGMFHTNCDSATAPENRYRKFLLEISFVICIDMPDIFAPTPDIILKSSPQQVVQLVRKRYEEYRPKILQVNPNIEIMIQTGRVRFGNTTTDVYSTDNLGMYWKEIAEWSNQNRIRTFMYEAFDQPWKANPKFGKARDGQSEQGWWKRVKNGGTESIVEKISGKTEIILSERKEKSSISVIIITICSTIALIGLVLVFAFVYKKHFRPKTILSERDVIAFHRGNQDGNYATPEDAPYDKSVELSDSELRIDESCILGSGQFGIVKKGIHKGKPVAIKTVKAGAEKEYILALLTELKVMIFLGQHPNLVNLIGAQTNQIRMGTLNIVLELCSGGSLREYLVNNRKEFLKGPATIRTQHHLLRWAQQTCSAMEYMEIKKVIHADLAIRNILLTEDFQAKVGDFGLSRKLYQYAIYQKNTREPLPWRWMAIEALQRMEFSHKSDVWSFGVLLWEMYSFGDIPYPGLNYTTEFIKMVEEGLRLHKPDFATDDMYQIMTKCWAHEPEERPNFLDLKCSIDGIKINSKGYNYNSYQNEPDDLGIPSQTPTVEFLYENDRIF